jgi:hypothetical protein
MIFLIYVAYGDEFFKKNCISEFLSQFHPISKKNRPNRSSGSEDIVDLKSTILGGFFVTTTGLQSS